MSKGFFTERLAEAAREEGLRVIDEILGAAHPCMNGWPDWIPRNDWEVPVISDEWLEAPPTFWDRRKWAYGVSD